MAHIAGVNMAMEHEIECGECDDRGYHLVEQPNEDDEPLFRVEEGPHRGSWARACLWCPAFDKRPECDLFGVLPKRIAG